jgi:hypothetical protein
MLEAGGPRERRVSTVGERGHGTHLSIEIQRAVDQTSLRRV